MNCVAVVLLGIVEILLLLLSMKYFENILVTNLQFNATNSIYYLIDWFCFFVCFFFFLYLVG